VYTEKNEIFKKWKQENCLTYLETEIVDIGRNNRIGVKHKLSWAVFEFVQQAPRKWIGSMDRSPHSFTTTTIHITIGGYQVLLLLWLPACCHSLVHL